jgi:GrpB protein
MFKGPDTDINLHVFTVGAAEIGRMLLFRDRLWANDADRDAYLQVRRDLAKRTWRHAQHYADAKTAIVDRSSPARPCTRVPVSETRRQMNQHPSLPPADAAPIGAVLTQCLATHIARLCMAVGLSRLDAAAVQADQVPRSGE